MLVTQFDKFVNRSTQEILGSEIERENLVPMLSTDIVRTAGGVTGVKGENELYYRTGNVNLTSADIGALDDDNVYNGLDQTDSGYALDARQGKTLNDAIDNKLDKANVYNGLDKTVEGYALDARQGKTLNDNITDIQSGIANIQQSLTTVITLNAIFNISGLANSSNIFAYRYINLLFVTGYMFKDSSGDIVKDSLIATVSGVSLVNESFISPNSESGDTTRLALRTNGEIETEKVMKARQWYSFSFTALLNS